MASQEVGVEESRQCGSTDGQRTVVPGYRTHTMESNEKTKGQAGLWRGRMSTPRAAPMDQQLKTNSLL